MKWLEDMHHASAERQRDLVIPSLRFKRCIIEALVHGKIIHHRFDLELTRSVEMFQDLKECQKKRGRVRG